MKIFYLLPLLLITIIPTFAQSVEEVDAPTDVGWIIVVGVVLIIIAGMVYTLTRKSPKKTKDDDLE